MILAVEADGASYRDSGSVRDRDRLRKEHLERLGWRFHRLWSTNWFHDPMPRWPSSARPTTRP
jgi:very-short-patch-repair endonuclease